MPHFTPLDQVPKDFDPNKTLGVLNPMSENFEVLYGGKPQTLKPGEKKILPEPLANHVAYHLADKICRHKNIELLQVKFKGLDESGREKWRINEQILYNKQDIESVKKCLLFSVDSVVSGQSVPEATMPTTKFDSQIETEKSSTKKNDKKEEEKKKDEKKPEGLENKE
ncbi:MAG: hypothetical protein AAB456_03375 [Patescibacteria group bacterium]